MDAAVILAPPGPHQPLWQRECVELCRRMRWQVVAVTQDPETARRYVADGAADRVVVARPAHARAVAVAVTVACDPPGRPGTRDPDRPRRLT